MKTGSGVKFSDWAVVILAGLLFFKTAEVLSFFAPQFLNDIIGQDVGWLYGLVTAFFVEGIAIAFHFHPGARVHTPAVIVKWILIVLSGLCQVFDGRIVTQTIANMPDQQRLFFNYGIPLLPWFVIILLFFVGEIPSSASKKRWSGLKHLLPDMDWFLEGDKESTEFSQVTEQPLEPSAIQKMLEDPDSVLSKKIEEVLTKIEHGNNGQNP